MKRKIMPQKSKQIYESNWLTQYQRLLEGINAWMLPLLLLPLLMTACAPQSTLSAIVCPVLPPAPLLTQSLPQVPYSELAAKDIKEWQEKVTNMQMMLKRSTTAGLVTTN